MLWQGPRYCRHGTVNLQVGVLALHRTGLVFAIMVMRNVSFPGHAVLKRRSTRTSDYIRNCPSRALFRLQLLGKL